MDEEVKGCVELGRRGVVTGEEEERYQWVVSEVALDTLTVRQVSWEKLEQAVESHLWCLSQQTAGDSREACSDARSTY